MSCALYRVLSCPLNFAVPLINSGREKRAAHINFSWPIVRMVWPSHTYIYQESKDQSGKVVNPARGQLKRETKLFLVSRDGFGSPVPLRPARLHTYSVRLNLALTYYGIPPDFRGGVHLFI